MDLEAPFEPCGFYRRSTDEFEYVVRDCAYIARHLTPDFVIYLDMADRSTVVGARFSGTAMRKAWAEAPTIKE